MNSFPSAARLGENPSRQRGEAARKILGKAFPSGRTRGFNSSELNPVVNKSREYLIPSLWVWTAGIQGLELVAPEFSSWEFPPDLQPRVLGLSCPRSFSQPGFSQNRGCLEVQTLARFSLFGTFPCVAPLGFFRSSNLDNSCRPGGAPQTHLAALIAALMSTDPALTGVLRSLLSLQDIPGWIWIQEKPLEMWDGIRQFLALPLLQHRIQAIPRRFLLLSMP